MILHNFISNPLVLCTLTFRLFCHWLFLLHQRWQYLVHYNINKKVLLREHKRHTICRVASARYAALSNGGGGLPHPVLAGGVPYPVLVRGVPPSIPGMGTPPVSWMGYPSAWTWDGVPPISWMGYPLPGSGIGYPDHPDLGQGTTPPPVKVWTDKQTENSTFPILRMRVVIIIEQVLP